MQYEFFFISSIINFTNVKYKAVTLKNIRMTVEGTRVSTTLNPAEMRDDFVPHHLTYNDYIHTTWMFVISNSTLVVLQSLINTLMNCWC